jgi:nitrogen-specific signal transduction histidine kinase
MRNPSNEELRSRLFDWDFRNPQAGPSSRLENGLWDTPVNAFLSNFLLKFFDHLKNVLSSIGAELENSIPEFRSRERGETLVGKTTGDIRELNSLVDALWNFIHLHQPMEKMNSVHLILEEILEELQAHVGRKKIRVHKKFEENLPEVTIHDQKLKYILKSILQIAVHSMPALGGIVLLTRSLTLDEGAEKSKVLPLRDSRYVDIAILLIGVCLEPPDAAPSVDFIQRRQGVHLMLRLVQYLVEKHRGSFEWRANKEQRQTFFTLRFPAERRKVAYYPLKSG